MAGNVKLKTLYVMKILLEKTDENHLMTSAGLIRELSRYDMTADRKSIYNDIETLRQFGLDIVQQKGLNPGYYVYGREFELPELKLLVDAVLSSKFITSRKSKELIKKLQGLASEYEARQLQRNVFIYNRFKTGNETIYYNVDQIHTAILENCQISFQYAEWTVSKKLRNKKDGAMYIASPWALTWEDENYYLIAYDEQADAIKHYRVDKMRSISVLEQERRGKEQFRGFDLGAFSMKTFGMFGGRDEKVILHCDNRYAGVIIDRFGKDVTLRPVDDQFFSVKVLISVSPQFFGWVAGMGEKVKINGPDWVQEEYLSYLTSILDSYNKKTEK